MPIKKYIKLSPIERELMDILNQHPHNYISTVTLREYGILQPSQVISSLKRKGAIFGKLIGYFTTSEGRRYKRIAFFRFEGWCHDE